MGCSPTPPSKLAAGATHLHSPVHQGRAVRVAPEVDKMAHKASKSGDILRTGIPVQVVQVGVVAVRVVVAALQHPASACCLQAQQPQAHHPAYPCRHIYGHGSADAMQAVAAANHVLLTASLPLCLWYQRHNGCCLVFAIRIGSGTAWPNVVWPTPLLPGAWTYLGMAVLVSHLHHGDTMCQQQGAGQVAHLRPSPSSATVDCAAACSTRLSIQEPCLCYR